MNADTVPVYHVVSGLMFGGGQQVAIDLVRQLHASSNLHVQLIALGDCIASGFPLSESHAAIHLRGYDGRYNRPSSLLRAALSLRRLLRSHPVEVVHSHGWDCDVIVGLARVGMPIRQVAHQHILADWSSSSSVVHSVRRAVTRVALDNRRTSWVAVSHAVKESLAPLGWLRPGDVRVVRNAVDLTRFQPPAVTVKNFVPVIGAVARLVHMKGLEYLIQAVADLRRRGIDCTLRIAGDGPLRSALSNLAVSLGINDRVILLGQQHAISNFYRSLDLFALPSVSLEGLPLSILEAMASGLPVVSTRVSGIPEAVIDGVTGKLVAPRDVHGLANALEELLCSSALRARMGHAGRERAESEFAFDRWCREVRQIYGIVDAPDAATFFEPRDAVNRVSVQ